VLTRIGHGKDYYLAACYPALFALGAVALAPHITTPARKAALALTGTLATAAAAFALPIALPVLAPDALAAYMQRHGLAPQAQERNFHGTQLPQVFADQLGWHDFAAQVLVAWQQIPAEARSRTAIMADNYGEAAALDLYAAPHGLPPALSGHNQYHLWGLRGQHPADLVTFAASPAELAPFCARVTQLGETRSRWAMAYENGKAIVRCEGLKRPLATIWPRQKHFD
jgi:hypothetical protein